MSRALRVFSFGGGVQSVAVLCLQVQSKLAQPHDAFVFANVGKDSENPDTLDYLEEFVKPLCAARGIRFAEVYKTRFNEPDTVYQSVVRDNRSVPIPVKLQSGAFGNRSCTNDFKIEVVDKWIRQQGVTEAIVGIGFSAEEGKRIAKKPLGWHDHHGTQKFGFSKLFEFPLIPLMLRRRDCERVIVDFGLPVPPPSLCWFCPFNTRGHWIEMKQSDPARFEHAVTLEHRINEKRQSLDRDTVYLHRDGISLEAIGTQLALEADIANGACEEGYCGL